MTHRTWLGAVCLVGFGCQQDLPPPRKQIAVEVAPTPKPPPQPAPPPPVPTPQPEIAVPRPPRHISQPTRWFLALSSEQRRNVKQICRLRADDPCAGMLPKPQGHPDPIAPLLASLADDRDGVDGYCAQVNRGRRGCDTPLVLALDAQPVVFDTASSARFAFHAGDAVATDWPSAETPWIAIDRDGNGAITTGAELFGDATVLADGTTAHNGFAALAMLDTNSDGTLDAHDAAFASLLLWADRNGDRTSAPDELRPLASVVTSIPLANTRATRCNDRGDCEGERGIAHWRDGLGTDRIGAVVDVYLRER